MTIPLELGQVSDPYARRALEQISLRSSITGGGSPGPPGPQGPQGDPGPSGPPGPSTGPAGGDLSGTYPNPVVVKASGPTFTVNGRLLIPTPGIVAGILLGGDVNLYRSAADVLKTDDQMRASIGFMVDAPTADYAFRAVQPAGNGLLFNFLVNGHTYPAFQVLGDGLIGWGAGSTFPPDTNLYRSAAGILKTDNTLYAGGAIWANQGGAQQAGLGAVVSGQAGLLLGAAGDVNLYRYAAGVLRTDGKLTLGISSPLSSARLAVVQAGNGIEFGHHGSAGQRSTLGANAGNAHPFLAFNAEAGTNNDTFRTRGVPGVVIQSDMTGGLEVRSVPNPNADNQAPGLLLALSAAGSLNVPGSYVGNGALPTGGAAGQVLVKTSAIDYAVGWVAASTASAPPLVSVLPSSPVDGAEVYFQSSAMATAGIVWHLRYRAASASAYKWEVLGAPPLKVEGTGGIIFSVYETVVSLSAAVLTTAGPSITLPLSGEYDVVGRAQGRMEGGAPALALWKTGDAAVTWDRADALFYGSATVGTVTEMTAQRRMSLTAGNVVELRYATSNSTGGSGFYNRNLYATPVRVG